MDLSRALPDEVILEVLDEEWVQTVDYKHIPFRCRKCHEHGHLIRDCPLNKAEDKSKLKAKKDTKNFLKVSSRGKGSKKEPKQQHKEGKRPVKINSKLWFGNQKCRQETGKKEAEGAINGVWEADDRLRMKQDMLDMIFIQEMKSSIQKIKSNHSKWLHRFEFLEVKADNTARGILTLWNPQKVRVLDAEASRNYLSVVIQPVGVSETFLVTNVYGPQRLEDKLILLETLTDLRDRQNGIPWILGEDFNMIKSLSEKIGGTRVLNKDSLGFQSFTENLKLVDSESDNFLFTWNNKRGGEAQVASKLDRFLILGELMLINNEITTKILPFGDSDHRPIQLEIKSLDTPRNRPFRFENIWLSHLDFLSNIKEW
eukprot:PITA_32357